MQRTTALTHVVPVVLASFLSSLPAPRVVADPDALNRSLYVPVRFELCEHLHDAVLLRGEEVIRLLPGEHTFQFTYYPSLGRLVPEVERVRIRAVRENGEPFKMELVVTSSAVYIGDKCIQLDLQEQLKRLRVHVDVHYDPVILKITCGKLCAGHRDPALAGLARPELR